MATKYITLNAHTSGVAVSLAGDHYHTVTIDELQSLFTGSGIPTNAIISEIYLINTCHFTVSTGSPKVYLSSWFCPDDKSKYATGTQIWDAGQIGQSSKTYTSSNIVSHFNTTHPFRAKTTQARFSVIFTTDNIKTLTYYCNIQFRVEYYIPTYTATFKNYDGTVLKTETVNDGATPTPPSNPTRTGYTFSGWSPTVGAISANTTYTAQFTENKYTIAFNGNGNTGGSMSSMTNIGYDDSTTLTANAFTKTGYTFNGWNTKADGSGTSYADKASVSKLSSTNGATVTLYAKWKANSYTIKFNANGGSGSMSDLAMTYDTAKNLTVNSFTRTGYDFLGWSTSSTATTATYSDKASVKNLTSTNNGTVNLYAVWKIQSFTISISIEPAGAGTVRMYRDESGYADSYVQQYGSASFDYGAKVDIVVDRAEGYKFSYWKEDNSNRAVKEITVTGDATYTAVCEKITYTANFLNGNGSILESVKVAHGDTPVCSKTPTKASTAEYTYTFSGWTPALGALTANQTYTPNFTQAKRKYEVTIYTYDCTVEGVSSGNYEYGTSFIIKVIPNSGYTFETISVYVDGNYLYSNYEKNELPFLLTGRTIITCSCKKLPPEFLSVTITRSSDLAKVTMNTPVDAGSKYIISVEVT